MAEQRNIVILGASFGGIQSAQYISKHLLPVLNAKHPAKYHIYIINLSTDFYFRNASPRTAISTTLLPTKKILVPLSEIFVSLPKEDFTLIQGEASQLDTSARTVSFLQSENGTTVEEKLAYHALIVATGTSTHDAAFSLLRTETTTSAIEKTNQKVKEAKSIIVVGGGATGVETAAEVGEFLNGKPGWFSTPPRKVPVTLITSASQLLPALRPKLGKVAEDKLKALGVDVLYNTYVEGTQEDKNGKTVVILKKGEKLETDLYIAAHGVYPNSSFLPAALLDSSGYLKSNESTLRVDVAGPRVYALGDISTVSNNTILALNDMMPVLFTNLKRDLFSFNPADPTAKAPGKDQEFKKNEKETLVVSIGSQGGVGAAFGWRVPNWVIWLMKSRDMMSGSGMKLMVSGKNVVKEFPWKGEEVVRV
ncbi:AMID-like mitochondrial oxidoreductase-like protein [Massarina eburnea CBS 473.64]|uniref:AMID-like mitochondrial oxidoreductase-like protein n=1 Tax=Massarina eburnea CBS 473.64 TaxID=1395130 RepID=A0A6A6RUC5_9PLEO|nr:AMID-like mitochondrial oxidoreductase-like protein [Massarina eburnea CBS 473.64]